jgi:hypothetical protein
MVVRGSDHAPGARSLSASRGTTSFTAKKEGKPVIALLLFLGCFADAPPENVAKAALAVEPGKLSDCEAIEFAELRTTCQVSAAAHAAAMGDDQGAWDACMSVDEGLWRFECHFRAGEELGRSGRVERALAHCVRAGQFSRNCVTHAGWGMPPIRTEDPLSENALSALLDLEKRVKVILAEARPGVAGEGVDVILSRGWFNLYYGTGVSDPKVAKEAPGEHAAHARTAFALEAVRLIAPWDKAAPKDTVQQVQALWNGRKKPIVGKPLGERRLGRYVTPIVPEDVRDLRHVATFGGGFRMVGESANEDIVIASLEALFFRETTTAESFRPFLTDKRNRVRWTAGKLFALAAGQGDDDVNAILEGDDQVLSTYVWAALVKNRPGAKRDSARP